MLARATIILRIRYTMECFMDMPMQVNGSRDLFPIPFRKFFNLCVKVTLLYIIVHMYMVSTDCLILIHAYIHVHVYSCSANVISMCRSSG